MTQATVIRGSLVAGKAGGPGGGQAKPPGGSAEDPFRGVPFLGDLVGAASAVLEGP